MKLAIVGYGKMGKLVGELAGQHGFETAVTLDEYNNAEGSGIEVERFRGVDVAIEFSTPGTAIDNLERLAAVKVPVVCGTTGWYAQMNRVCEAVERNGTGLVYSANFSVGVQVFQKLAEEAARLLAQEPGYEAWAWEIHHSAKKDAPSGTLLKLVDAMRKAGYGRAIDQGSNRAGRHPGTHEIGFDSAADTITLRHAARSREGFAHGALKAARWVIGKKGVYEFSEVLFGGGTCS